jgi:LCP family protein required for cell wall assembly
MEGDGGVSVSDLVERHTGSRTNLQAVPQAEISQPEVRPDDPHRHHAAPEQAQHSSSAFPAGPAADVAPETPRSGRRRAADEDSRPSLAAAFSGASTGRRAKPESDAMASDLIADTRDPMADTTIEPPRTTGRRARADERRDSGPDELGQAAQSEGRRSEGRRSRRAAQDTGSRHVSADPIPQEHRAAHDEVRHAPIRPPAADMPAGRHKGTDSGPMNRPVPADNRRHSAAVGDSGHQVATPRSARGPAQDPAEITQASGQRPISDRAAGPSPRQEFADSGPAHRDAQSLAEITHVPGSTPARGTAHRDATAAQHDSEPVIAEISRRHNETGPRPDAGPIPTGTVHSGPAHRPVDDRRGSGPRALPGRQAPADGPIGPVGQDSGPHTLHHGPGRPDLAVGPRAIPGQPPVSPGRTGSHPSGPINRMPATGEHPVRTGPARPAGRPTDGVNGAQGGPAPLDDAQSLPGHVSRPVLPPVPQARPGGAPGQRPAPGPNGQRPGEPTYGQRPIPDDQRQAGTDPQRGPRTGAHPVPGDSIRGNGPTFLDEGRPGSQPVRTGTQPVDQSGRIAPPRPGPPTPGDPARTGTHPMSGARQPTPGDPIHPGAQPIRTGSQPVALPGPPVPGANRPVTGAYPMPGRQGAQPMPGDQVRAGTQPVDHPGPRPGPRPPGDPSRTGAVPIPQVTGQRPIPGPARPGIADRLDLPRIPRQLPPGQSSMPPTPPIEDAETGDTAQSSAPRVALTPPPSASKAEIMGLTTEMEAIGEATQKRRRVDETLARFSKVHDDLKAEEKARKSKLSKLNPWAASDAALDDHLDELAMVPGEAVPVPVDASTDDEPSTRLQEKKTRKQTQTTLYAKVFAGTMAALVFVASGIGWGFKKWANDGIDHVRALDPNSQFILDAEGQRGDENFLLVGSDTREGATNEDGVGDANAVAGARSDTMMVAHIPADRSRVVVVSFPRDLEITRPRCERFDPKSNTYTGEQVPGQKVTKMNTAYEVGGPLCVTQVVQAISGLSITRFVGIDFNGFKGMVDAVDGVTVCVEKPMYDTFMKKWVVKDAGKAVELRGDQALDFVRARHVRGDPTSDYGRIIRQQRFLSSLLRKAMSGQVLLDPGKLTGFVSSFADATFGDNIDLDALMKLGQSMQGIEAGRVTFITIPTVGIENKNGNEELLKEPKDALFRAIRNNQPLPGEAPAPSNSTPPTAGSQQALPQSAPLRQQPQPVDPKTVKIQVLNGGNSTGGIAKRTADKLTGHGFTVVAVNPTSAVPKTVVRYGKGKEAAAQTLASSVPGAALEEDPATTGAVVLIIGPEFKGEIVAPTGSVAPPAAEKLPANLSTVNGGDVTCA